MAESTLALKFSDLQSEVGLFLGWGRGEDAGDRAWSSQEEASLVSIVRSGLRQFYFPPVIEGSATAYDWSFLKPFASLSLASGDQTLTLPDDFGGIEGRITVSTTSSSIPDDVPLLNEGLLNKWYSQTPDATGRPKAAALQPVKGTHPQHGQRWNLFVFPEADAAYTLEFAYYLLPNCLTGDWPYAYGGASHAETLLESCLAIAEQRLDDSMSVHSAKFQERLRASIAQDRKHKPQTQGYNGDASDYYAARSRYDRRGWNPITINGTQY